MKKFILSFLFVFFITGSLIPVSTYAQWGDTSRAQTGLAKSPLSIKTKTGIRKFTIELADTLAKQQVGMMWRTSMQTNEGMLFDYIDNPHRASFWMENTILSLDLIYVRADGTIANIVQNAKPLDRSPLYSKGVISAVLEIKGGEANRQGIKAGDIVIHPIFGNMGLLANKKPKK